MQKPKRTSKRALLIRVSLSLLLIAAAIYVLNSHWPTVVSSLHAARHARAGWFMVSLALMALTFAIAAAIYGVLALHPLRYRQTMLVEVAATFVNRLLPAGLGGLGLHGLYLHKRKHTPAEATAVVSVNNLLGIVTHFVLLGILLMLDPQVLHHMTKGFSVTSTLETIVIALIVLILLYLLPPIRHRLHRFVIHLFQSLARMRLLKLLTAMVLAALLTATYASILWASARSVGISLNLFQVFVIFTVGQLVSTISPTPGGLVGAEAGLFAGFVAYGIHDVPAGAAVLLFRLATYWLPLIPGALALVVARHRSLV